MHTSSWLIWGMPILHMHEVVHWGIKDTACPSLVQAGGKSAIFGTHAPVLPVAVLVQMPWQCTFPHHVAVCEDRKVFKLLHPSSWLPLNTGIDSVHSLIWMCALTSTQKQAVRPSARTRAGISHVWLLRGNHLSIPAAPAGAEPGCGQPGS